MSVGFPEVSIIVPCLNEEATIELLLGAILTQNYSLDALEVVVADGMSEDGTRDRISRFQTHNPGLRIHLVDNPDRVIPAGLNRAIQASAGDYIIRLDAHSIPSQDYVRRCVDILASGKAENVGGAWDIRARSDGWVANSIAAAAGHPIGVGDAHYRFGNKAGYVDTVPFGAFDRQIFDQIGLFDEKLLTNEDYELNARIRKTGGKIWFDPGIRSIYFSRESFGALARQYFRYGFWKWQMLKSNPKTLRWRQALPPLFVSGLALLLFASPWILLSRWLLLGIILLYFFILFISSIPFALRSRKLTLVFGVPVAIATMHFSWGAGFLWSMVKSLIRG